MLSERGLFTISFCQPQQQTRSLLLLLFLISYHFETGWASHSPSSSLTSLFILLDFCVPTERKQQSSGETVRKQKINSDKNSFLLLIDKSFLSDRENSFERRQITNSLSWYVYRHELRCTTSSLPTLLKLTDKSWIHEEENSCWRSPMSSAVRARLRWANCESWESDVWIWECWGKLTAKAIKRFAAAIAVSFTL